MYDDRFWRRVHQRAKAADGLDDDTLRSRGRQPTGVKTNGQGKLVPDYDGDFRAVVDALHLREEGASLKDAAKETGIPSSTLYEIEQERKELYLALAE
jgi:hypothetical protein